MKTIFFLISIYFRSSSSSNRYELSSVFLRVIVRSRNTKNACFSHWKTNPYIVLSYKQVYCIDVDDFPNRLSDLCRGAPGAEVEVDCLLRD